MTSLFERDSIPRVLDAAERCMRLCRQNRNADKYEKSLIPSYNDMMEKNQQRIKAGNDCTAAYDLVRLFDLNLDDCLRKVHSRSKEYDRENPGSSTLTMLFPKGNITPVITMPLDEEPDEAEQIAQKLTALGEQHPLYPLAKEIIDAVADCRKALKAQEEVTKVYYQTRTAAELSKLALIRQYNGMYFVAASEVGKSFAERLFPQLSASSRTDDDENPTQPAK